MPVQFADVNWRKEEIKAVQGHTKRREQRVSAREGVSIVEVKILRALTISSRRQLRRKESKKRMKKEIEEVNEFFQFLWDLDETELRVVLKESIHAMAFFMIVYGSHDDEENMDRFVGGEMAAEKLPRSELLMAIEWRDSFASDGLFKENYRGEVETRQDSQGDSRRQ